MSSLYSQFTRFLEDFKNEAPVTSSSQTAQEAHADRVVEWFGAISNLEEAVFASQEEINYVIKYVRDSAKQLFNHGDEISAWVGQMRIANVAERIFDGPEAAFYLADAALSSTHLFFHDHTENLLGRMKMYFTESNHPLAAIFWGISGFSLSIRHKWLEAIPSFQLSLEHLQNTTPKEISKWFENRQEDLIADKYLSIAHCWMNSGWDASGNERFECAKLARKLMMKAMQFAKVIREKSLLDLNEIELLLLEGKQESARIKIDKLSNSIDQPSPKFALLRLGLYSLSARLADLEDNRTAMLSFITRAIADSALFPDAMQELLLVDHALDLIRRHALERGHLESLLDGMIVILEAKDWYTGRAHSKSVVNYTLQLWDAWQGGQSDPNLRQDLYWAGYLHDVGKLRLPRSLLNKIAPLSNEEWKLIRLHPEYSQKILEAFGLIDIARWAGEHHQDSIGSGYPGQEPASPMGMCIAIADFFEAATSSNRRYKKPKTIPEALQELNQFGRRRFPEPLIEAAGSVFRSGD
jgi:HD-GYP domain-containing protein (c-di-GMP phosphodiesterase class II)